MKKDYNYKFIFYLQLTKPLQNKSIPQLETTLSSLDDFQSMNVFQNTSSSTFFIIIQFIKTGNGAHKSTFSGSKYKGYKILNSLSIESKELFFKGIQKFFQEKSPLKLLYGPQTDFNEYLLSKSADATFKKTLKSKSSKQEEIFMEEFISLAIKGEICKFEDFYSMKLNNIKDLRVVGMMEKDMNFQLKMLRSVGVVKAPTIPIIQQLQDFIQNSGEQELQEPILTSKMIEKWGYTKALKGLYEVIVLRRNHKRRAVWLWGPPNTGKSHLCSLIEKIFICDHLVDGDSHFHVKIKELKENPQVVIIDEANIDFYFKYANIAKMKRFLEGKGWVADSKFGEIKVLFQDAYVLITSNDMPLNKVYNKVDREAFGERMKVVHMNDVDRKDGDKFPFTAVQLAKFFLATYEKQREEDDRYNQIQDDKKMLSVKEQPTMISQEEDDEDVILYSQ